MHNKQSLLGPEIITCYFVYIVLALAILKNKIWAPDLLELWKFSAASTPRRSFWTCSGICCWSEKFAGKKSMEKVHILAEQKAELWQKGKMFHWELTLCTRQLRHQKISAILGELGLDKPPSAPHLPTNPHSPRTQLLHGELPCPGAAGSHRGWCCWNQQPPA